jgi:hypothetical protein
MADQTRPTSPQQAQDPSYNYERSHPGRESGQGRLDAERTPPHESPDKSDEAVQNRQPGDRQINAQDDTRRQDEQP